MQNPNFIDKVTAGAKAKRIKTYGALAECGEKKIEIEK